MTTPSPTPAAAEEGWQKTACILCECNCGLEVLVDDRKLTKIRGDKDHPGSAGYTCEKPLRLDYYQNGPHRLTTPMRRTVHGTYEPIDWDTALDEIAARLHRVKAEYGGESIFFYGGGGQGNHLGGAYGRALFSAVGARYMSNALAQEKTGEAWVDQQLYGNHTSGDFEHTEVAIFIGKNPWQSHGVARARPVLKEISRDPDRAIIVIDPRKSETAAIADFHLQIRPGTDAWCVSAIVATIVQEELHDTAFLREHTTGSDTVVRELLLVDIPAHARRCGVDEHLIRTAARRIAAARSAATYEDLGVQQSPNSTLVAYLNKMMWMLTGNFGKPGGVHIHSWMVPITGRWYPIPSERPIHARRVRRAVGKMVMSSAATLIRRAIAKSSKHSRTATISELVGVVGLAAFFDAVAVDAAHRIADALGRPDENAGTPVSGARIQYGLTPCNAIADEILTDHPERLRAMWIDASNPAHSLAESGRFIQAMRALDMSVVIDVAMTETARQADYVLPAASQFEKHEASLFTLHFPHNSFQLRRPLMSPLPGTRDEPWIYAQIIDRLQVVDQKVIDDLTATARCGRHAFALAFFATIESRPELAGLVPYLLYRTLGGTFDDGEQALALIWGMAHLAAIAQPDALCRAGHNETGFSRGEQLFEAIRARPEGVLFSDDRYQDAWKYVQHDDGRIHMHIPVLLDELARLRDIEPPSPTAEFPFILSAGERRAFTANVIIRNPQWRRRDSAGALRINPDDAAELGIDTGAIVRIITEAGEAKASVEVSGMMQPGHISLPNGMGVTYPTGDGDETVGVPLNTLTSATRRDKFFGSPWHKYIPARIETIENPRSGAGV
ncbi:molybdopterin-dependent oxidoreductase [Rhodococcus qingshengii]|uniref:molybdopterin-dependent oxidoreductase n=1 Tax=Rhodococcus qingshengii TaxID=334542 RepID=UPI00237D29E2|nr:molybdopterin-dependent oxidoreductase [Rhodococcus qingshengii]WCT06006.1 molybdopterin-dependent oxidoreductase [Rhodococcus qingshengii]